MAEARHLIKDPVTGHLRIDLVSGRIKKDPLVISYQYDSVTGWSLTESYQYDSVTGWDLTESYQYDSVTGWDLT